MKKMLDKMIQKLPYIGIWRKVFLRHSTPGSYSSPVPNINFIKNHYEILRKQGETTNNINANIKYQLTVFTDLAKHFKNFDFPKSPDLSYRYYSDNIYYNLTDALILFSLILTKKPKKIIEIGSGYSSALILDLNKNFFNDQIQLFFIEPNPARLQSLLKGNENFYLIEKEVQFVSIEYFNELEENDILFVDSSHVTKAFSDVNHILFNILPNLNKGVLIHFHDIYENFEYPIDIIENGYYWNESYLLRAFLMYNESFSIEIMNSELYKFVDLKYKDLIRKYFIQQNRNIYTGGFWLSKNN